MNKRKVLTGFFTLVLFISFATGDFRESMPVGPGVVYHHDYRSAGPWHFFILEIDLTNPYLELETVKANDLLYGNERTSSMAARRDQEGHRVVGAINGDFYASGGIPINAQVCQGVLLRRPNTGDNIQKHVFGVNTNGKPFYGVLSFSGTIWTANHTAITVNGINESRGENQLIVYNKYMGSTTGTNYWGTEISALYLNEPIINDTIWLVVTNKDSIMETGHGNNAITGNGVVLSGHGTARTALNSILVGDTIKMLLQLNPAPGTYREMIGGGPQMIVNGVKDIPNTTFCTDRHPRTAIGFNRDSTKVFFFVVDGRQPGYSVGTSLFELADYMLEWGVYQGMNFDGGGSSTMVVRHTVKNKPSDGSERAVANALLLISQAPTSSLQHLRIEPRQLFLLPQQQAQFTYQGYDEFWNPLGSIGPLTWDCSPHIGTITPSGLFTAATDTGSGWIYLASGEVKDSVLIHVTDIAKIVIRPNPVVLKVDETQQMTAQAYDGFNNQMDVTNTAFEWSVSGNIGTITSAGLFTATQLGNGWIKAAYRHISDSVNVLVGSASSVTIDAFNNTTQWSLTGTQVDINNCAILTSSSKYVSAPSSLQLKYALTGTGTSALYMNCAIPISGTPDAISIWVYGDGHGHWLRGEFADKDNEKFLVDFTPANPGIDWSGNWRYIELPLKNAIPSWSNPSAVVNYPIKWTRIYIAETNAAKKDTGSIYFDDFMVHFVNVGVQDASRPSLPQAFTLHSIYPNPFNNTTNIHLQLYAPGQLEIDFYDITGRKVDRLTSEISNPTSCIIPWQPPLLTSGLYFLRIKMNAQQTYAKCLMLK
jgi:hypothetical protein